MKLHGSIEVFLDVAMASTVRVRIFMLLLFVGGATASLEAAAVSGGWHPDNTVIDDPGTCPSGSLCVRPMRCAAAMELYWDNLTLAMGSGTVGTHRTSPLKLAYQQCWISTNGSVLTEHAGICCQMVPTAVPFGGGGSMMEPESNDINRSESTIGKRSIPNYDQLIGSHYPSDNQSRIRTKRCIVGPECTTKDHRYRSFDGKCNNVDSGKSLWGSAGYPMERILPPAYGNGISSSRVLSHDGRYLPSSRVVSDVMFIDLHVPHPKHNLLMVQLGQFLVHDISRNKPGAVDAKCCLPDNSHREPHPSPACSPIRVASKDSFYSQFNVKCLHFVRTAMAPRSRCGAGHGRQLSEVTHFIDGSGVYGSSDAVANELRSHQGGRLKSIEHRHMQNELLPLEDSDACKSKAKACFKAGDNRVNQVVTLAACHTLFLREHNRIAKSLEEINPHWNDEVLFHETRRIVIAELQHIIYNEYLPKIVGPDFMEMYDLHTSRGFSKFYNPEKNPALTSEFSAAAFRFGHSTVPGQFAFPKGQVNTHDTFFDPSGLAEPKFFDELYHGLMTQPMQQVDDMFSHSITWFMNPEEDRPFGADLAAINIQRGRDHAIQPYNYYQHLSGREVMRSFGDFGPIHGEKLNRLYSAPDDVDLYVGAMLEPPVSGGVVGLTFAEIISDQFARLKLGDRYFYSNGPRTNPGHFTKAQLQEVQKMTLAGILCANVNDKENFEVTPEALNLPHAKKNPFLSCRSKHIPRLNLIWWKD